MTGGTAIFISADGCPRFFFRDESVSRSVRLLRGRQRADEIVAAERGVFVPAEILNGRALAQVIRRQVAADVADFTARTGVAPGLTVILVGDNPASQVYVRSKESAGKAAGIKGDVLRLPAETPQDQVLEAIEALNNDPSVHGILVQLPLPAHLDERAVIERVSPLKDVDGFHPFNFGLLAQGTPRFVPCTPLGIQELFIQNGIETRAKHAVVLGRSLIVGKPMALLLLRKGTGGNATVTVCHTATPDAASLARQADLLIVAMGQPRCVTAEWIKPGAVVIDVGMNRREDGSLCGDVDFTSVAEVAGRITPVPGGVGPMTIAMLLQNTVRAARLTLEPDARALRDIMSQRGPGS
jgi:methylenetetrahydrofolate dehydrogenase (NADP+)/methenyltetrahydrofolate cyclohydrolase